MCGYLNSSVAWRYLVDNNPLSLCYRERTLDWIQSIILLNLATWPKATLLSCMAARIWTHTFPGVAQHPHYTTLILYGQTGCFISVHHEKPINSRRDSVKHPPKQPPPYVSAWFPVQLPLFLVNLWWELLHLLCMSLQHPYIAGTVCACVLSAVKSLQIYGDPMN